MFKNRGSFFKKNSDEFNRRDVTLKKKGNGKFDLSIEGGIENNLFPKVTKFDHKVVQKGKLHENDVIIAVDGAIMAGEPHKVVREALINAGDTARLTVCTFKNQELMGIGNFIKYKGEMAPEMAQLQDDIRKKMYDMSARFTTRPRGENEVQGREFNFVSEEDFKQLREFNRFVECSQADDGFWYGTIFPTKEMADPETRLKRQQELESLTSSPTETQASANDSSRGTEQQNDVAERALPAQTEMDDAPVSDEQVQTIVLARKNGRLGFKFDGGVEFGVLLTVKEIDDMDVISSTNRDLAVGDSILAVNNTSVAGCTVEEAEEMIRSLDDPIELTTTCVPNTDYIQLVDFLKISPNDSEALKRAKEDVKRDVYSQTVPYTTRAPREGEVDGEKYNFVSKEKFEKMKKEGRFLEWGEFDGVYYGTPKRKPNEKASKFRRSQSSTYVRGKQIFRPSEVTVEKKEGVPMGLVIVTAQGKTYVKDVEKDSAAYRAKLRPGMLITEIEAVSAQDKSFEEVSGLISKAQGELKLKVKYDPKGHEEALKFAATGQAGAPADSETTKAANDDDTSSSSSWVVSTSVAAAVVGVVAMAYQYVL